MRVGEKDSNTMVEYCGGQGYIVICLGCKTYSFVIARQCNSFWNCIWPFKNVHMSAMNEIV